MLAPYTRTCGLMSGTLFIRAAGVSNGTLLAEAFPNLRVVTHGVYIESNPNLVSIDGAFPNLQTVGGQLRIYNNARLTSIGTAFSSLQSVNGQLQWYHNGGQTSTASTAGSVAFCASARGALCASTDNYAGGSIGDDSWSCCTAYCATTTDC